MSLAGLVTPVRTHTLGPEDYDHAIKLVDSSKAEAEDVGTSQDTDGAQESGAPLSRQWTKKRLRDELARRKYAKWQEGRNESSADAARLGADCGKLSGQESSNKQGKKADLAGRLQDRIPFRGRKKPGHAKEKEDYEIDILYENQRGSFLCGIPLYSSKSLLNFDPSGWQTSTLQDSPVNITNAQVPDPSWVWAWHTWYVDMSRDVDEEGWEYSFNFSGGFAWHGSHPWFHSFVRRRRWLRKRVKIHPLKQGKKDDMKAAHQLTAEYFTIHPKRDPSPESIGYRTTADKSSYFKPSVYELESDDESVEISDLVALMSALRKSRLDREKIIAISNFLEHGGEELFYLSEKIVDIMGLFVYQTSRRQLQTLLLEALDKATEASKNTHDESEDDVEAGKRKTDNLSKAVDAADVHINDQDYWSDIRTKADSNQLPDASLDTETLDATKPSGEPGKGPEISEQTNTNLDDDIKGIPEDAHISEEPGIQWNTTPGSPAKGKEKA